MRASYHLMCFPLNCSRQLLLFTTRGRCFLLFDHWRRRFRRWRLAAHRYYQRTLHVVLNALQHLRLIFQSLLGILAALTQTFTLVREPGAAFFNDTVVGSEIQQIAFARNAFAVHDVELSLAERRRDFIL